MTNLDTLRIRCAERMGWRTEDAPANFRGGVILVQPDGEKIVTCLTHEGAKNYYYPDCHTDRNALMELIQAVPEEKRGEFIDTLVVAVGAQDLYCGALPESHHKAVWMLLTASPEAVMKAWLEVMENRDTVDVRVPIPADLSHTGEARWAVKPIDAPIADIVRALNEGGVLTRSSCCGHGERGEIVLQDGRRLAVMEE
jgi:hypothetical protein